MNATVLLFCLIGNYHFALFRQPDGIAPTYGKRLFHTTIKLREGQKYKVKGESRSNKNCGFALPFPLSEGRDESHSNSRLRSLSLF